MKATAKQILITILAIIITATIVYAGVSYKTAGSASVFYSYPGYKAFAACYQMCS